MQGKIKRSPEVIPEERESKTAVKHKILPVCFLCNLVPKEGIRSGFFLKGFFICSRCEQDLINFNADDAESYKFILDKLRAVLFKKGSGSNLPEPHKQK